MGLHPNCASAQGHTGNFTGTFSQHYLQAGNARPDVLNDIDNIRFSMLMHKTTKKELRGKWIGTSGTFYSILSTQSESHSNSLFIPYTFTHSHQCTGGNSGFSVLSRDALTHGTRRARDWSLIGRQPAPPL